MMLVTLNDPLLAAPSSVESPNPVTSIQVSVESSTTMFGDVELCDLYSRGGRALATSTSTRQ